ncbi:MAG: DUF1566 domain-containing protein [Treponema sp.]|nr:DUF1566 domain-containing protein [Treponema sp.]
MNKYFIFLIIFLSGNIVFAQNYSIGDTGPAGGIIFYDKGWYSNGWRYLEASRTDVSANAVWNTAWQSCSNFRSGNRNDWTLPRIQELDLMYRNLKQRGLGNFGNNLYWSSNQSKKSGNVFVLNFTTGNIYSVNPNSTFHTRAVRRF